MLLPQSHSGGRPLLCRRWLLAVWCPISNTSFGLGRTEALVTLYWESLFSIFHWRLSRYGSTTPMQKNRSTHGCLKACNDGYNLAPYLRPSTTSLSLQWFPCQSLSEWQLISCGIRSLIRDSGLTIIGGFCTVRFICLFTAQWNMSA